MTARVYPSQQDTNLTAIGSLLVTYDEVNQSTNVSQVQCYVNSVERKLIHNNTDKLYSTFISNGDIVRILVTTTSDNNQINVTRRDYTTDDQGGDMGIRDVYVTGVTGYSPTTLEVTFTVSPITLDYNFEYLVNASVQIAVTQTPTPTPTITPTSTIGPKASIISNYQWDQPSGVTVMNLGLNNYNFWLTDNTYQIQDLLPVTNLTGSTGTITKNTTVFSPYLRVWGNLTNVTRWLASNIDSSVGVFLSSYKYEYSIYRNSTLLISGVITRELNYGESTIYGISSDYVTGGFTLANGDTLTINWKDYFQYEPNEVHNIIQLSNGNLFLGGFIQRYSNSQVQNILPINENGCVDTSISRYQFDANANINFSTIVNHVEELSNGKFILSGRFNSYAGNNKPSLVRINSDGTLDYTYSGVTSGFNSPGYPYEFEIIKTITVSDKTYVIGYFLYEYNGTAIVNKVRLNNDGSIDNTYNYTTATNVGAGSQLAPYNDFVVQNNGYQIFGGYFASYGGVPVKSIMRLDTSGNLDTTFSGVTSGFTSTITGVCPRIYSLCLTSTEKIYVGGFWNKWDGYTNGGLVRLNNNGSIDLTFSGITTGFNNVVYKIVELSDGKILVGGQFTTYNGTSIRNLVRLNSNGSVDSSFNIGTGFNNINNVVSTAGAICQNNETVVFSIKVLSDGRYAIGGRFSTYNGTNTQENGLIILNTDGTVYSFTYPSCPAIPYPIAVTPTPTPTNTVTPSITPTNTPTRTVTPTPTNTVTPSITPTNTVTPTKTVTPTPTNTVTPTPTPTLTTTPTPTPGLSPTPSATPQPIIIQSGLTINVNGTYASYPGTGTTWTSIATGTTYNGDLINGPTWNSGTGGYFSFDGVNDYCLFPPASAGSNTVSKTFGGWVRTTTSSTDKAFYFRGEDGSGAGWSLSLYKAATTNKLAAAMVTGVFAGGIEGTTTLVSNTWYYVIGRWSASGEVLSLFVNGLLENSVGSTGADLRNSTKGWQIARYNGLYRNMDIGDFELYERSLSDAEILQNFNTRKYIYGY